MNLPKQNIIKTELMNGSKEIKQKTRFFKDEYLIKKYCDNLELTFKDYETLLKGNPSDELLKTEYFLQYKKEFDKWSDIKNLKKRKSFKDLDKDKKEAKLKISFYKLFN